MFLFINTLGDKVETSIGHQRNKPINDLKPRHDTAVQIIRPMKSVLQGATERKLQTSSIKRTGNNTNRDIIAAID